MSAVNSVNWFELYVQDMPRARSTKSSSASRWSL